MNAGVKFLISLRVQQENVSRTARGAISALDALEAKARSVGRAVSQAFSFGNLAGQLSSIPGFSLLTNPYALVSGGLAAVSKIGMQAEQTSIAFKTLVGDGEKANRMLAEIAEFADRTPFDRMGLTAGAQQMLSFGVEADKVTGYLKQLGDISGGDAGKLSTLALVFGQVTAAGKLSGQDNMQFVGAGFNPLKELAKMTGESFQQMQERMQKGQITAENVAQAIAHATAEGGQFHGMMDALGDSGAGSFNTMMGAIQTGMIEIYDQIKPYLLDLFAVVSEYAPKVFEVIGSAVDFVIGTVSFIKNWREELLLAAWIIGVVTIALKAQAIGHSILAGITLVVKTVTAGWTAAQWLLNAALAANPIGLVVVAVVALVGVVVYCWNKFAGFRAFLLTMCVGKASAKLFSGDFSGAAEEAKNAVKGFAGIGSAGQAFSSGKELISGVGSTWDKHLALETAKQTVKETAKTGENTGISTPSLLGSSSEGGGSVVFGTGSEKGKKGKGGRGKTGDAIATGGTRNTQITMTIGKLIERIEVTMMDKTDTSQLDKAVLASVNRALAIATSTDR